MAVCNELVFMFLTYHMIYFSKWVPPASLQLNSPTIQDISGSSFIIIVALLIIANAGVVISKISCKPLKQRLCEKKVKEKPIKVISPYLVRKEPVKVCSSKVMSIIVEMPEEMESE